MALKLSRKAFDRMVEQAVGRIPGEIRRHMDNLSISVQARPSAELLQDMGMEPDDLLLGLYQGVPLPERSVLDPPLYPDLILLFQEDLEAVCETLDDLAWEIEVTVVHEVAHFLGMDEERLTDLGYA